MKPFYQHGGIEIWCGDCLEIMPRLEPPFNAIIADWPYGTTQCSWDSVIPLEPLWKECKRLSDTAVLFGSQPFTSKLVMSNLEWFKYEIIWDKVLATGHLDANRKPLKRHENILVFGRNVPRYNPEMVTRGKPRNKGNSGGAGDGTNIYHSYKAVKSHNNTYYPTSIYVASNASRSDKFHPIQKPEPLMAYLIRTYTNPGDIILDNTMGSGTTLLAAQNEGRRAVGIEMSEKYCKIAVERLRQPSFFSIREPAAKPQPRQVDLEEMIERGLE